jgi:transposase
VYLEIPIRRVLCQVCGTVKRESLDFLSDNPFYTKRFSYYVGRRCRASSIKDIAKELHLDWHTVKELEKQYMREQLRRAGTPGPKIIGTDEVSIRKGHTYRIVVSDLVRERPIWFGGTDRSEASMDAFYKWLGPKKSKGIRMAVMDMWKPFMKSTKTHAPQAAVLFDKFHVMRHLGEALDKVRRSEYHRLSGKDRAFVKGQRYNLLSRWRTSLTGRQALRVALRRTSVQTAYLLKESFDQLWDTPGKMGPAVLRQLEGIPEVAAAQTLRDVRRDGGAELERDRGVLRVGGEGLPGVRGGRQHQDPGHPAAGVRPSGRRVPSPESPHLHAARDLKWSHSTHSITR